jgi:hypothetical protein
MYISFCMLCFLNIRGDICKSKCTTGINDTGGKFASYTASVVDTSGKFATGDNDTGGNLPLLSTTPMANNENNIRLLTP